MKLRFLRGKWNRFALHLLSILSQRRAGPWPETPRSVAPGRGLTSAGADRMPAVPADPSRCRRYASDYSVYSWLILYASRDRQCASCWWTTTPFFEKPWLMC